MNPPYRSRRYEHPIQEYYERSDSILIWEHERVNWFNSVIGSHCRTLDECTAYCSQHPGTLERLRESVMGH